MTGQDTIERVLEHAGYRVLQAENGRHALELAEAHEGAIDLLVSDVRMPELGGIELAEELRRSRPHVGLVFMSGYPHEIAGQVGTEARILAKPFTPAALIEELRTLPEAGSPPGSEAATHRN